MRIMNFSLTGKLAIITGGSQGIGKSISLGFAKSGADVVIADLRGDLGEDVVSQIRAMGKRAMVAPLDVTKKDQVTSMVEKTVSEFGRIDVLVNNAGGASGDNFGLGRVSKISEKDWDSTIAVNLKSVFLVSQAVAPIMLEQKKGIIINMASIAGQIPFPGMPAYSASKAAVISLTKSLAIEFAPYIRVNAIAPGLINTPRSVRNRNPERLKYLLSNVLLERQGQPEEVASIAIFLASDAAEWITGTIMDINGGQMSLTEWGRPLFRDQ